MGAYEEIQRLTEGLGETYEQRQKLQQSLGTPADIFRRALDENVTMSDVLQRTGGLRATPDQRQRLQQGLFNPADTYRPGFNEDTIMGDTLPSARNGAGLHNAPHEAPAHTFVANQQLVDRPSVMPCMPAPARRNFDHNSRPGPGPHHKGPPMPYNNTSVVPGMPSSPAHPPSRSMLSKRPVSDMNASSGDQATIAQPSGSSIPSKRSRTASGAPRDNGLVSDDTPRRWKVEDED